MTDYFSLELGKFCDGSAPKSPILVGLDYNISLLPSGLMYDKYNSILFGNPTVSGVYTLKAIYNSGSAVSSATFQLNVTEIAYQVKEFVLEPNYTYIG